MHGKKSYSPLVLLASGIDMELNLFVLIGSGIDIELGLFVIIGSGIDMELGLFVFIESGIDMELCFVSSHRKRHYMVLWSCFWNYQL